MEGNAGIIIILFYIVDEIMFGSPVNVPSICLVREGSVSQTVFPTAAGILRKRAGYETNEIRRRLRLTTRLQQNTFVEDREPNNRHITALKRERGSWLKLVRDNG